MTHDEMIAVIQAHKDGKKIERRSVKFGPEPWSETSVFDFTGFEYRIAPEPKRKVKLRA